MRVICVSDVGKQHAQGSRCQLLEVANRLIHATAVFPVFFTLLHSIEWALGAVGATEPHLTESKVTHLTSAIPRSVRVFDCRASAAQQGVRQQRLRCIRPALCEIPVPEAAGIVQELDSAAAAS